MRKVKAHDPLDLRDMRLADPPDCGKQGYHLIAGQAVKHVETLLAAQNQARLAQLLKVLGSVGNRGARHVGELLDRALGLREQLQELDARRAGKRRADARQVGEDFALGVG